MQSIFLICPVRGVTKEKENVIFNWVSQQEQKGVKVHWPQRDTNQDDDCGIRICRDNISAIKMSDSVAIFYDPASHGSIFDLGVAMALGKTIKLINPEDLEKTSEKSFANVILSLSQEKQIDTVDLEAIPNLF